VGGPETRRMFHDQAQAEHHVEHLLRVLVPEQAVISRQQSPNLSL
jgi:hypothetical protein